MLFRTARRCVSIVALIVASSTLQFSQSAQTTQTAPLGFRDFPAEDHIEKQFMAVPDPRLAEEHLRILTSEPHLAGTPEDKKTAEYVAAKFRDAGLETQIQEYRVWMNYPKEISVDIVSPKVANSHFPTPERVSSDPFQNDPRVVTAFNEYSPSGDVEADVVYANYGRPEDFDQLAKMHVDVRGKILIVRYGENYRGVKSFVAEERGAAGVIIYSDPIDDGYFRGDKYPAGPWRPDSGVQRGSIGYMFMFPGDPTTPGVASVPSLPADQRIAPEQSPALPKIPTTPLSYQDATPILQNLGGPDSPRKWQGALPFTYHVGPGPARVKMHLKQDYAFRPLWVVTGTIPGSAAPDEWVVAGNHRDAWVYGAVDPNSGTAAMLEAVHGVGQLLRSGWRPKRTVVFCSWDGEEEGLIGSTEWAEQHANDLQHAAAYFNMDVGVAGSRFSANAIPSLKEFIRDITKAVPSPAGGSLYAVWKEQKARGADEEVLESAREKPPAAAQSDVSVGDLGSGSDYTAFLQHLGVPSADIASVGPYGVYHSVFDNFAWFTKFADPTFVYEQQMARVFGLEVLRMADADVLPYDYATYGDEIVSYLQMAQGKAVEKFGSHAPNFATALDAAKRLKTAGAAMGAQQSDPNADGAKLNAALLSAERELMLPQGLPGRPWFKHAIYAPGKYTGYAAVVIPGVNEAIDAGDAATTEAQLGQLTTALNRAAQVLEAAR